ncbi:MAG: lamin tail domain-containing protein [Patescibacteria group bacterium]
MRLKKLKKYFFLLSVGLLGIPGLAHARSGIFLSEVMFNPTGVDTGYEYIKITNSGSEAISLTGWTLYPDGVGYFSFPERELAGGSSLFIYLRSTGSESLTALYHSGATGNMGNTSGSVALFSSSDRTADTIVDFVQYGREGKTWESTAEGAGLWKKGDFVVVDSAQEGIALRRKINDTGVSAWEMSTQKPEIVEQPVTQGSQGNSESTGAKVYSGPTEVKKIRAYAGSDQQGVVGGVVLFSGTALGWSDEKLESQHIRYVWNFGDGAVQEGKNVSHAYLFPGTYSASLIIAQGEESAEDRAAVLIEQSPIFIGEIFPGNDAWVELVNPSGGAIDVSGWVLETNTMTRYTLPKGTTLDRVSQVVFPLASFGIKISATNPSVRLLYPTGKEASSLIYTGTVGDGVSVTKSQTGVIVGSPTPGREKSVVQNSNPILVRAVEKSEEPKPAIVDKEEESHQEPTKSIDQQASIYEGVKISNTTFFFGSIIAGILCGSVVLFLKRRYF